jgi:hypothetical protein
VSPSASKAGKAFRACNGQLKPGWFLPPLTRDRDHAETGDRASAAGSVISTGVSMSGLYRAASTTPTHAMAAPSAGPPQVAPAYS